MALDRLVSAVRRGDGRAFAKLTDRYRGELQAHCYRMMGSVEDAEDLVQETLLRAWQNRASFRGHSCPRVALPDRNQRLHRRPEAPAAPAGDRRRPGCGGSRRADQRHRGGGAAALVNRETVELAFSAAVQHLPPRQRAVLVLRAVLGWSSKDAALQLESSVASVNSALQRARRSLNENLPERRLEWAWGPDLSNEERSLLHGYLRAAGAVGAVS